MDCKHNKPTNKVDCIVCGILADYDNNRAIDEMAFFGQPDQDVIIDVLKKLIMIIYPGFYRDEIYRTHTAKNRVAVLIEDVMYNLRKQLEIVLVNDERFRDVDRAERKEVAQDICLDFFSKIPKIREYLDTDIDAAFDGDPAARDRTEIILAYPGLYAITVHRIAHELSLMNIPYIPRIMSEHAHSKTGVDIHPGASIGKHFFIDHATGIVIGETSIIGEHVKVYQGVTIGALSTKDGQLLHGVKRHPTIEDNVTLYAGATVLGGNTVIGHDSIIGGSAFVTRSIEPNTSVIVKTESTVISNI
ncbi:Serine acetyltransferase [[Eubacterium] infirmum]|nr:Serine acetyltransferase [[Eubacterium] infirmum]